MKKFVIALVLGLVFSVNSFSAEKMSSDEFNMLNKEVIDIKVRLDKIETLLAMKKASAFPPAVKENMVSDPTQTVYTYSEGVSVARRLGKRLVTFIKKRPHLIRGAIACQADNATFTEFTEPTVLISDFRNGQHVKLFTLEDSVSTSALEDFVNLNVTTPYTSPANMVITEGSCANGQCGQQQTQYFQGYQGGGCQGGNCGSGGRIGFFRR